VDPKLAISFNAPVETEHLLLEPITSMHADVLFEYMQDQEIYRLISAVPPTNVQCLRDFWARVESRLSPDGTHAWLNWAVRKKCDGSYVGRFDVEVDSSNVATNVGYLFFPAHWGKGYATLHPA